MTIVNLGTKKAEAMTWEWKNRNKGDDVRSVYGKCSSTKKETFDEIRRRACATEGYNHDLKVTRANCNFYSTMYSYTNGDGTFLVKDTYCDTFILKME